jgi:hypothetical protein
MLAKLLQRPAGMLCRNAMQAAIQAAYVVEEEDHLLDVLG